MQNLLKNTNAGVKTVVEPTVSKVAIVKDISANILESKYTSTKHDLKKIAPLRRDDRRHENNQRKNNLQVIPKWQIPAHFHLLVLATVGYLAIALIFWRVHPQTIAHFLLPNSYLPLLIIFFLANLCLFSFIFNHTRRGLLLALMFTINLFLLLQQILTVKMALVVGVAFLAYETVITIINHRRSPRHIGTNHIGTENKL
jgi:hypothetical protein